MTKSKRSEKDQEDMEAQRRQMAQGQTGGGTSRGPETTTTGDTEAQGLVPPYDRSESSGAKEATQQASHKAFHADEYGGEPGSEPPVSQAEREGVSPTDTTGATPLGVGESRGDRGEDLAKTGKEPGRIDTGPQGETQRPSGTSTGRDVSGVDPSEGRVHKSEVADDDPADDPS